MNDSSNKPLGGRDDRNDEADKYEEKTRWRPRYLPPLLPFALLVACGDAGDGSATFVSRVGEGPGELRRLVGVEVLRDNRLVVSDGGHAALLLFDANGEFVDQFDNRSLTTPLLGETTQSMMVSSSSLPILLGALPDDRLLAKRPGTRTFEIHTLGQGAVEFYRAYDPPVSTTQGGGIDVRISNLETSLPAGLFPRMLTFGPPLEAAVLTDGRVAVVDSVGYQVRIVQDDGTVDAVLERPIDPIPVTPEMREAARQKQMTGGGTRVLFTGPDISSSEGAALSTLLTESMVPLMEYASEVPVIDDLAVDLEDRIWVSRTGGDGVSRGPTDVLTGDGDYLGTLAADEFRIPDACGPAGLMAYIELDELDVATVRVVRLVALEPQG